MERIQALRQHDRGNKAVSINTYLRCLKAFLNWCHQEQILKEPVRLIWLKEEQKVLATFSPAHVLLLLHWNHRAAIWGCSFPFLGGVSTPQNPCGVSGDSELPAGSVSTRVIVVDSTALERVLLAVKVLKSCRDPKIKVTEEEIKQLRLPSDQGLDLSNGELAFLTILRAIKEQEDEKAKTEKPSTDTSSL